MEEIYTDSRFQIYIHTNMATFKINSYSNSNFFIAQDIHLEHIVLHVRNTHMIHYIKIIKLCRNKIKLNKISSHKSTMIHKNFIYRELHADKVCGLNVHTMKSVLTITQSIFYFRSGLLDWWNRFLIWEQMGVAHDRETPRF